jgi:hypothetical protein
LSKKELGQPETYYPLRLYICPQSGLAQVDYVVEGNVVYHPDYPYRSGITKELEIYLGLTFAPRVMIFRGPLKRLIILASFYQR